MEQRTADFWFGIMIGMCITVLLVVIAYVVQYNFGDKTVIINSNYLLNSNEWTIDTIKTINRGDTTITYKFVEVE